jgi:cytochrome c oxidase assembly protein subunit 15
MPPPGPAEAAREAVRLARAFTVLIALTFALIVLGALVRAHGAGLACPDWPLCFGELVPAMDFHVAFEWTHRAVAGIVAISFTILAARAARRPALRRAIGRPLALAGALLVLQIVLGGLTVLQLLAYWTVTAHLLTGNAFAATLLWIALRLRELGALAPAREPVPDGLRIALGIAAILLVVQIGIGGLVSSRYAGLACPDWPTCEGGLWFPSFAGAQGLQLLHRSNGYALFVALAACAWLARRVTGLAGPTRLAVILVLVQIALGVANVLLRLPVEVTGMHSAGAAALVLLLVHAARKAFMGRRSETREPARELARVEG